MAMGHAFDDDLNANIIYKLCFFVAMFDYWRVANNQFTTIRMGTSFPQYPNINIPVLVGLFSAHIDQYPIYPNIDRFQHFLVGSWWINIP